MKIINWKGLFGYKLDFPVHLCSDVLLELLRFGTRCNLARIEPIGRRFHRLIELYLRKAPFLFLSMQLTIRYDSFEQKPVSVALIHFLNECSSWLFLCVAQWHYIIFE